MRPRSTSGCGCTCIGLGRVILTGHPSTLTRFPNRPVPQLQVVWVVKCGRRQSCGCDDGRPTELPGLPASAERRVVVDNEAVSRANTADDADVYGAVLNHEHQHLRRAAGVRDLYRWRDRLIAELVRSESPYARALVPTSSMGGRPHDTARYAAFLDRWSTIVAETIQRLQQGGAVTSLQAPEELATAILAAIHGGVLLARVTDDVKALRNALRLPFDQLGPQEPQTGTE